MSTVVIEDDSPEEPNLGELREKLDEQLVLADAPESQDINRFAERLGLREFTDNEDDLMKFYGMQYI
jgi:hypothetical protein